MDGSHRCNRPSAHTADCISMHTPSLYTAAAAWAPRTVEFLQAQGAAVLLE